jgi:hypothetical protein
VRDFFFTTVLSFAGNLGCLPSHAGRAPGEFERGNGREKRKMMLAAKNIRGTSLNRKRRIKNFTRWRSE